MMIIHSRTFIFVASVMVWALFIGSPAFPVKQLQSSSSPQKGSVMSAHAKGTFEVKLTPQASDDKTADANLGRFTIDKQFSGDIVGTSKGQMLTVGTAIKGSAGYVAIEKITATLAGRTGTFILQHSGTMTRGTPQLNISVVPDSGTDQLEGLTGKMVINIEAGKHSYAFDYSLPEK
jgi:FlaG/FlaF family flagellin (archaellin)